MVSLLTDTYGFTQKDLAQYLGAEPSMLNRYDDGDRKIPLASILQMTALINLIPTLIAAPAPMPSEPEKTDAQNEAIWLRAVCKPLQKKLDAMQARYKQSCHLLQLLDKLAPATTEKEQRWRDSQAYQVALKQEKNGWLQQKKLKIQIALLQTEAAMWEAE